MKKQAIKENMRLADLMAEASCIKQKNLQELAAEELKIKMEIKRAKTSVKIMEGQEHRFRETAIQEDLGNKLSKTRNFLEKV